MLLGRTGILGRASNVLQSRSPQHTCSSLQDCHWGSWRVACISVMFLYVLTNRSPVQRPGPPDHANHMPWTVLSTLMGTHQMQAGPDSRGHGEASTCLRSACLPSHAADRPRWVLISSSICPPGRGQLVAHFLW